jgi:uncharacterized protein YyaL (SSP411 family)
MTTRNWTADEIRDLLGDEADAFMTACGVTRGGNLEGMSISEFLGDLDRRPALADARCKLFKIRWQRYIPASSRGTG